MKTVIISTIIVILLAGCIVKKIPQKIFEIVKPIKMKKVEWKEIYSLINLDKDYVAQGIEIYKNYLLFTVHKSDKKSVLLVFNIKKTGELEHIFSTDFPKIATHVSDLSIYKNELYAIDYASNYLYQINIDKTIEEKKLQVIKKIPTSLPRSGSIIVTDYKNKKALFLSQFIISNKISIYDFNDLTDTTKVPLLEVDAKRYIQGLYQKDDLVYVSSNKYGIDPIHIVNTNEMIKSKSIETTSTITITGPGKMIEDIVIFNNHIITSDEENNKLYISKDTIQEILSKENN